MTEKFNGESIYWNYWLHEWMTFSVSPFAQRTVLVPTAQAITSVTVTPETATLGVGQTLQATADVVTTGFASKAVIWTSSDATKATVDATGKITTLATGEVTITATSVVDSTKTDTCVVTIA